MPVHHIFVVNRAGSLIYSYDAPHRGMEIEKTFSFPLDFRIEMIDQRPTVSFGERDGIKIGHVLLAINGETIGTGGRVLICLDSSGKGDKEEKSISDLIGLQEIYPISLKFGRPNLTANEKIILSSMFHSLHAIGAQLSPVYKSSGIETLETETFRLHCYQTKTGSKFVVVSDPQTANLDQLTKKVYELYSDYALKNPFYSLDMPIRCDLFEDSLQNLVDRFDKTGTV